MKKIIPVLTLAVLLFSDFVLITGCAGGPNRVAYQTLATTRVSVETAMGLFNQWVKAKKAAGVDTTATELKVKSAFEKWQAAQVAVLESGKLNAIAISTNAAGATGVSAVAQDLISNAAQYKTDLFALLTQ